MCGICGIAKVGNKESIHPPLISSMCQTIIHRGPDDEGIYIDKNIALGSRRLSIIDLDTGHQPISNENGSVWVVCNGEIYNFPALKEELISRGHNFSTKTDTETIVHGYEEWGEDFIKKLRGMYAFALWDAAQHKLLLVRDRIGIKPLYYTILEDSTLVFGSELKAVLTHPGVKRSIEPQALDFFLTLEYIPAPYSIFKNIFKLPAACSLIYKDGKMRVKKYWELESGKSIHKSYTKQTLNSLMDELYNLLKESVKMRLISDVPLGAFLSGGIDSSSIVGLMRELGASPLKTFSIGFEDSTYNELDSARRIAKKFHTDHEEFIIQPQALELTEKLIHHLDEPFGDFSIFPTYLVSKMARSRVTVILSGDGGDEIFSGYEHYQAQRLSAFPLIPFLQKPLSSIVKKFPPSPKKKGLWNKLRRFGQGLEFSPELRHFRWMMFLTAENRKLMYTKDLTHELGGIKQLNKIEPFQEIFLNMDRFDAKTAELYLDLKTYLVDNILVKVDRMSMAQSLETRVPLLDHKIVEFIFKLPGDLKLKGMTTKWIFKKTMERLLPRKNIFRSKEGFSIPMKHWLRKELKELMLDYLSQERIQNEGLFNFDLIKKMIDLHLQGRENFSHQLWALLVFEIWKEQYL